MKLLQVLFLLFSCATIHGASVETTSWEKKAEELDGQSPVVSHLSPNFPEIVPRNGAFKCDCSNEVTNKPDKPHRSTTTTTPKPTVSTTPKPITSTTQAPVTTCPPCRCTCPTTPSTTPVVTTSTTVTPSTPSTKFTDNSTVSTTTTTTSKPITSSSTTTAAPDGDDECQPRKFKPLDVVAFENSTENTNELNYRRQFVVKMALEAWNSYVRYAWPREYLDPLNRRGRDRENGRTIISAMSTLYVMGLKKEFAKAQTFIELGKLPVNNDNERWMFDVHSALLSCYALTANELFLNADRKLAFIRKRPDLTNDFNDEKWEFLRDRRIEWQYLSDMTEDRRYVTDVRAIEDNFNTNDQLENARRSNGHYLEVKAKTLLFNPQKRSTFGDLGRLFTLIEELQAKDRLRTNFNGRLVYALHRDSNERMHLTNCAYGPILAFASLLWGRKADEPRQMNRRSKEYYMNLAQSIVETCHLAANSSKLGLPSDEFLLNHDQISQEGSMNHSQDKEKLSEAYFVLWRLTRDRKYQEYAWEYTKALYRHSGTSHGYAEVDNMNKVPPNRRDIQRTQLLSATLKYLYLIFSPVDLLPLDQWVFSHDGHPLPIKGRNPSYPNRDRC